jgi:hypothetical protein
MLGNDQVGDCTAAGAGHVAQAVNWFGQSVDAPVTDADAITMYSAISGYDPSTGANDVGATLQDALSYWRKVGIGGNTIAAFAQIDTQDLDMVRACIALFGAVYTGMMFPSSAMDDFQAGRPWTVRRSRLEGGHCVPIGAYDGDSFTCVTWGRAQVMTVEFYRRYFDECWVPIDLDWLTATGQSPAGLDVDRLNTDFTALTGEPGPFPQHAPPSPQPVPGPAPLDADRVLAEAFDAWLAAKGF